MGNAPSFEAEPPPLLRKTPHKLSKPRVGNHASTTTTSLLSSNGIAFSSSTARLSNSHAAAAGGGQKLPARPIAGGGEGEGETNRGRGGTTKTKTTKTTPKTSRRKSTDKLKTATTLTTPTATGKPEILVSDSGASPLPPAKDPAPNPSDDGRVAPTQAQVEAYRPTPPRKDNFQLVRKTLFRSKSSQGRPERKQWRASTGLVTTRREDYEMGRANSMRLDVGGSPYYGSHGADSSSYNWNQAGNRGSVNYDPSSYDAKRLMLDLTESPTNFEWESNMTESQFETGTVVSAHTWKSSHPTRPPSESGNVALTRTNSEVSLYAPMRRRSIIQTPGVATRARNTEPIISVSKKSSFRHSQPPTPSLSRKNSMDEGLRVFSLPPRLSGPEEERAVTPSDAEYRQLGSIKFGSLRITNGAPSPYGERRKEKEKGTDSAFRSSFDSDKKSQSSERPRSNPLSPITATFMKLETGSSRPNSQVKLPEKGENKKQDDYLSSINFASFSLLDERSKTPELQTTSKHTALEDDLFEDDTNTEILSLEVLDVRMDTSARKLPPKISKIDAAVSNVKSVTRSDSGFVSSPTSDVKHKPLSKADSGYSSNVSLRSLRNSKNADKELPPCPVEAEKRPRLERASSSSSFLGDLRLPSPTLDLTLTQPDREPPPPPLPPKDISPTSPTQPAKLTRPSGPIGSSHKSSSQVARKARPAPAPLVDTRSRSRSRSSMSGPVSPVSAQLSPASSDTSSSGLSIGSGSHRPGKLQRLLSGSSLRGPPSVHPTHVVDKSFPSVPRDIEAKLIEHTGLFPITTKRLAMRPQPSKETLGTIFSVGSAEAEDVVRKDEAKIKRRRSLQSIQNTIAHAAAAVLPSRKPVTRKVAATRENNTRGGDYSPATSVSGGDDVGDMDFMRESSAGNSAFDQAFSAMSGEREAYFDNPQRRSMTMNAQLERSLELRLPELLLATTSSLPPLSLDNVSPVRSSPRAVALDAGQMTPQMSKGPPVSMKTRPGSVRHLRVPPPLRPQSTPATGTGLFRSNTTSLSRQSSREKIHSYPPTSSMSATTSTEDWSATTTSSPPSIPPMHPRRSMTLQGQQQQPRSAPPLSWENDLQPRRSASQHTPHSRSDSMSSQGSSSFLAGPMIARPASASPYAEQNRHARPQQQQHLRHRASYDGHGRPPAPKQYSQPRTTNSNNNGSNAGAAPAGGGYQRQSPDPWTSTHYKQLQQQYGGGGWDSNGRYHPPYVPRSGHYRKRSSGSHGRPGHQGPPQAPYRILHSYNSPAYRHAPIWG